MTVISLSAEDTSPSEYLSSSVRVGCHFSIKEPSTSVYILSFIGKLTKFEL